MPMKLNMLPPSVNNLSVRVFVRAAGLPYEEENVWGQTQSDEYLAKYPAGLGRRAMVDGANFYTMSMLYPLVARATYPRLSFAGYPGEVATSEASDDEKEAARKSAEAELPRILEVYREFFGTDGGFIGGGEPTIADIRLASTLEFLAVTDTE